MIQDAEDPKDDDATDHLWDSSMEESFVTEKELENFLKGMRQYTTGVREDGNSEINNVKNTDSRKASRRYQCICYSRSSMYGTLIAHFIYRCWW